MKPEDIQDLKQLIEFLKENQVAEFDLDRGDMKIRLKFTQASAPAVATSARQCAHRWPRLRSTGNALRRRAAPLRRPILMPACTWSSRPSSAPFMALLRPEPRPLSPPGDHVEKGQVICIIEAMKLMNEIEADVAGEVVRCLVTNGQPIEFGQPLFAIRTERRTGQAEFRSRAGSACSSALPRPRT